MSAGVEIDGGFVALDDVVWPLSIGGSGCDLVLDLPETDLKRDARRATVEVFVQSARPGARVTRNGDRVDNAQWLRDGDRIGLEDASVVIDLAGDRFRIRSEPRTG